jgi:hypothetical protein
MDCCAFVEICQKESSEGENEREHKELTNELDCIFLEKKKCIKHGLGVERIFRNNLENKCHFYYVKVGGIGNIVVASTSSRSQLSTKRLTSTPNDIIYY